ncbi:hypothetical protein [Fischerella thermalis]|uniref:hypothetical protein n=1 Tax=Fischerella thermalis TaxID=372787 RepID=UPI0019DFC853|nr:hypothetical protein [Fischerella thermalis]MBF1991485.1 hypothetical protein [Fischerella thermalis M58_A2018_009]MBF2059725.1 hypothetical protein [Fischerella thermalis M66_A2018_004]
MDNLENRHQTTQFVAAMVAEDNLRHAEQLAAELNKQDRAFLQQFKRLIKSVIF